jgi:hypothetical protein
LEPFVELTDQIGGLFGNRADRVGGRVIQHAPLSKHAAAASALHNQIDSDRWKEEPGRSQYIVAIGEVEVPLRVVTKQCTGSVDQHLILAQHSRRGEVRHAFREPQVLEAGRVAIVALAGHGRTAAGTAVDVGMPGVE